ncbi:MAG: hypothetical protein PHY48_09480 [Candidatus Cloacimonetes bacterium]|jgi:hypothetical protein|nr:hypothetical protein [Candidatus Cloacimonadota bacterium]
MNYDTKGNLTPYQQIEIDAKEFESSFVDSYPDSKSRTIIFNGYCQYQTELIKIVRADITQWINGSWTTTKLDPKDMDLVNIIPHDCLINSTLQSIYQKELTSENGSSQTYNVDAYIVVMLPETDPRYTVLTKEPLEYWHKWWGHDRQNNPKGYVALKSLYVEVADG